MVLNEKKAPPTQSTWSNGMQSVHFSPIVSNMNSLETSDSPNMAGKDKNAVKRISLRNTRFSLSLSSAICASTGCATCSIVPEMVLYAIVFHLLACVKFPTAAIGNLCPMMKVSTLLLMVFMIEVMRIFTLKENISSAADNAVISPGEGGKGGRSVYSTLILGDNAYGVTELTGGGLQHIVKQLGSSGTADPLNQRATAGWKATKTAERLVEQYMIRIESASTFESAAN